MTMQTPPWVWIFGLLLPPFLALLYAVAVLAMYTGFCEWHLEEKAPSLWPRLALLAGGAAITYSDRYANVHGSDLGDVGRIALLATQAAIVWSLSYFCALETRLVDVVGGSDPKNRLNHKTLADRIVLITGANAGIGKETARQLTQLGAGKIILACRSAVRGREAMDELMQAAKKNNDSSKTKPTQFIVVECDLGDFDSIRKAVDGLKERQDVPQIDLLILNAGVMMSEKVTTKDGCETMMQANLLGHFLLTRLLMAQNLIRPNKKKPPRVIHLTSSTHQMAIKAHGKLDLDDLMCDKGKRPFRLFEQYGQSKLGNIFFAKELARRYPGTVVSLAVHPGIVRTDVTRNMPSWLRIPNDLFGILVATTQKSVPQGAWCTVAAATLEVDAAKIGTFEGDDAAGVEEESPSSIPNGSYLQNGRVRPTDLYTYNEADACKLWDMSEKLVGLEQK